MAIYLEKSTINSPLAQILERSGRNFQLVDDVSHVADSKSNLILVNKKDVYCHPCPGTRTYRCCGYHTSDVMEGCPFDCSYCILQAYLSHTNIQVSADTDGILASIRQASVQNKQQRLRLGTGELSDSLALDHIFPFSRFIVPVVNELSGIQFEFKTKSTNIANLLDLNPKNVLLSWSLNPAIHASEEKGTAPVSERINAARICAEAGYRVAFHFDPLIYSEDFTQHYGALINELFMQVPKQSLDFISLSSFRGPKSLFDKMRERESTSKLLKGDFITGIDGKYRYFKELRLEMLSFMTKAFLKFYPTVLTYYCMEHSSIWQSLKGFDPGEREEFECMFEEFS